MRRRRRGRPPRRPCRRSRSRGPRSRGRRPPAARRSEHPSSSPSSFDDDPEPGGVRRPLRVGGLDARGAQAPARCRGSCRRARRPSRPASRSETHSQTLPACCSAPNGPAPAGCASTGTVQPQPDSAHAQRSGSNVSPHGYGRPSVPRAAASHSSPVGSRTGPAELVRCPRAERLRVGEREPGGRVVGERVRRSQCAAPA